MSINLREHPYHALFSLDVIQTNQLESIGIGAQSKITHELRAHQQAMDADARTQTFGHASVRQFDQSPQKIENFDGFEQHLIQVASHKYPRKDVKEVALNFKKKSSGI